VLALQGGFSYQTSVFNRATQAERQPGSSFKPFVYAAALDKGYTPATIILDAPITVESGGQIWRPQNASERYYGPAPMRIGLEFSRNLMTIRLAQEIGMATVSDYAERFGVYDDMPELLSYALGAGETTLYQMVAAYAMFANGGRRIEPTVVDRVQGRRGDTIWRHDAQRCPACAVASLEEVPNPMPSGNRIMDPITAYQVTSMLEGTTTQGTATRAFADVPVPVAGKTGTTNEARDVWFVGFTSEIAAGCFVGYDEPTPLGRGAFGGTICAPVVAEFFREVYRDRTAPPFRAPPGITRVTVNRWTGRPQGSGEVISEVFREGNGPEDGVVIGQVDDTGFFSRPDPDTAPEPGTANPETRTAQEPGAPRASDGFSAPGGLY
jgi:penicillin-binding protein 1A